MDRFLIIAGLAFNPSSPLTFFRVSPMFTQLKTLGLTLSIINIHVLLQTPYLELWIKVAWKDHRTQALVVADDVLKKPTQAKSHVVSTQGLRRRAGDGVGNIGMGGGLELVTRSV